MGEGVGVGKEERLQRGQESKGDNRQKNVPMM